jgi:hypothetical protein
VRRGTKGTRSVYNIADFSHVGMVIIFIIIYNYFFPDMP